MPADPRRRVPGVDRLLASDAFGELLAHHPRERVVEKLRRELDALRARLAATDAAGEPDPVADPAGLARVVAARLRREARPSLRAVINATGVVLHTNLGRAPLAGEARTAMDRVARGYSNLEFDLERGGRGSRHVHCAGLVSELTAAEDALVVNNNAAAVALALDTLARGRAVIVSRGELVEIGGGFRIPDVLERAGARLREVGTTNRTRPEDYAGAAREGDAAVLLKVHRSNFRVEGFTEEAPVDELAAIAAGAGLHLVHDVGSGLLADPERVGLPLEPRPTDSLAAGAHLVAFSGDKLLGGPQAGILAGREDLVARVRRNPLYRALRVDKATLAALEATLALYRNPEEAVWRIPTLRMLAAAPDELRLRAEALRDRLGARGVAVEPVETVSAVGGGSMPGVERPSWAVAPVAEDGDAEALARRLREGQPPVVGRIREGRLLLDLRTVDPEEEQALARRLVEAAGRG